MGRPDIVGDSPAVVATVTIGAVIAVAAVVCQSALYLWSSYALERPLYDIGGAATFNTWAGDASLTFCAATASVLAASVRAARGEALALSPLLVFFAIDEGTEIHDTIAEHVVDALGIHVGPDLAWPLLYAPLLILAGMLLMQIGRGVPAPSRVLFKVGTAALAVAVLAQLAWGALEDEIGYLSKTHILQIVVEEGGELGGWLAIGTGLAATVVAVSSLPRLPLLGVASRRGPKRPDPARAEPR